jgi:hypothetical protein
LVLSWNSSDANADCRVFTKVLFYFRRNDEIEMSIWMSKSKFRMRWKPYHVVTLYRIYIVCDENKGGLFNYLFI